MEQLAVGAFVGAFAARDGQTLDIPLRTGARRKAIWIGFVPGYDRSLRPGLA